MKLIGLIYGLLWLNCGLEGLILDERVNFRPDALLEVRVSLIEAEKERRSVCIIISALTSYLYNYKRSEFIDVRKATPSPPYGNSLPPRHLATQPFCIPNSMLNLRMDANLPPISIFSLGALKTVIDDEPWSDSVWNWSTVMKLTFFIFLLCHELFSPHRIFTVSFIIRHEIHSEDYNKKRTLCVGHSFENFSWPDKKKFSYWHFFGRQNKQDKEKTDFLKQ